MKFVLLVCGWIMFSIVVKAASNHLTVDDEKQLWKKAGFGDVSFVNDDKTPKYPTSDPVLDISIVAIRGTNWSGPSMRGQLQQMVNIYKQCNIHFGNFEYVYVDPPRPSDIDIAHSSIHNGYDDRRIAEKIPSYIEKPIIFFVRKNHDGQTAWSYPEMVKPDAGSALINTIWLTYYINTAAYQSTHHYGTTAHEMTHLLMNMTRHLVGGTINILTNDTLIRNNHILASECKTMRKNAYRIMKRQKRKKLSYITQQ